MLSSKVVYTLHTYSKDKGKLSKVEALVFVEA